VEIFSTSGRLRRESIHSSKSLRKMRLRRLPTRLLRTGSRKFSLIRRKASADRRSGRQSPREQLRGAMQALREHRDFPEPWRREPFDRSRAIDALMNDLAQLGALAATSSWPEDYLARNLTEISRFVEESTRLESVRDRDYDGLEAELRSVSRWRSWAWKGAQRTTFGTFSRNEVLVLRDQAKANLDAFIAASDADLAPLLHDALQAPIRDYEFLKTKAGRLDFLDLLIKTRDLIRADAGVRGELQQRFSHFFVDEFQDTDPLQAEILLLLAADDPRDRLARCPPKPRQALSGRRSEAVDLPVPARRCRSL
jgi:ATP-dependent helicase/nuclease subunit A